MLIKSKCIIVGSGIAGLSVKLFLAINKIEAQIISLDDESLDFEINNFPGKPSLTYKQLKKETIEQIKAIDYKFNIILEAISSIEHDDKEDLIYVFGKTQTWSTKYLVICTSFQYTPLNIQNFYDLNKKGIVLDNIDQHCKICNKTVIIIGGGDRAFIYIDILKKKGCNVIVLNRSNTLKNPNIVKLLDKNDFIQYNIVVNSIDYDEKNQYAFVSYTNKKEKRQNSIRCNFVLVAIGIQSSLNMQNISYTKDGFIQVNSEQETCIKNVFAAGVCSAPKYQQIINCCHYSFVAAQTICERERKTKMIYFK